MPVGQAFDFTLQGAGQTAGFMLARGLPGGARAWTRTGQPDSPARRSPTDTKYGNLPDELDHPEVFNDWSGGFGDAYRQPDRLNTYHWAEFFDTRWPGQLTHAQWPRFVSSAVATVGGNGNDAFLDAPAVNAARQGRGGIDVWVLGRGKALVFTPGNQGDSASMLLNPATVENAQSYGHRPALFASWVLLPVTDGSAFLRVDITGGAATAGPLQGRAFAVAGNRLWRAHGPANRGLYLQSIAAGADPLGTANWSATLSVGDGVSDVEDMIALNDQVFVGNAAGLHAGDATGTFFNVLAEVAAQRSADNCRDLAIYGGAVHAQTVGGVWRVEQSPNNVSRAVVREVGPGLQSGRSPLTGYVRALKAVGPWLYAGLWTGSQSYILAGIDASPGLPYVWHSMQRLPYTSKVHRIHVDGATVASNVGNLVSPRFWVATDATIPTGGTSPGYIWNIPPQDGNPLAPCPIFTGFYHASARIDFAATDWQAPGTPKIMRALEVWSENLASGAQYADVFFTVDNGARTLLGRVQDSPKTTLYFPTEGAGASFVTGQSIALSLESFTASYSFTPVYRSFVLRGLLNPKSADVVSAVVRVADGVPNRMGVPGPPGASLLASLRAFAAGVPAVLTDTTGAQFTVKVLQPVSEQEVYQAGAEAPEIAATVKMAILTFTGA